MAEFDGKAALVTGGGSGIGRVTALALAREGASVCVSDIAGTAAEETAHTVTLAGGRAIALRVDVTDEAAVAAMVRATLSAFGRLDAAFNNAGIRGQVQRADEMELAEFRHVLDINVVGVFLCQREELKAMYRQGAGAIVNSASIMAQLAAAGAAQYVASKSAILGLTRTAALEAAPHGVRVNAVAPGTVETPLNVELAGGVEQMRARWGPAYPMGRLGQPEEVAEAVIWLLGGRASFVTGQALYVEGGMLLR
jgi:NAD(P)-dependent dehydrogenase (short-subunit alcohol dehydrogenase family)